MGYDPKERAIGWNDVEAGYLLAGIAIAGFLLIFGGGMPEHPVLSEGPLHAGGASFEVDDAATSSDNGLLPMGEAEDRAAGETSVELRRSCAWQRKLSGDRLPYAANR